MVRFIAPYEFFLCLCGSFGEVESGELAVVLLCGLVVGFGGFDFVFKRAETGRLAVAGDLGVPYSVSPVVIDALIPRAGFGVDFLCVAVVLGAGRRAQVGPSVIQAVMIDMVHHHAGGNLHDAPVHVNRSGPLSCGGIALGVERMGIFRDVPIMFTEPLVIAGINDGVFSFRQGYPAEGVAVAQSAVQQHEPYGRPFEPRRDFDNDFDDLRTRFMSGLVISEW
jgi:hypothetical protein